jgi:predicted AlkP superfamily phosphohydrolase/phosphomutase
VASRPKLVDHVLLVALDGAEWRVLDPLMEEGRLPNLSRLVRGGVSAELRTLEPTVSPAIWTTIATGALPRFHGILGFDGVPGATMKTLPNAKMRRRKAYWEILSDFGVTTGTIGWWATWPADPLVAGSYLISDRVPYTRMEAAVRRTTITPQDAWPPELLDRVAPLVERPDEISPAVVDEFLHMGPVEMKRRLLDVEYRMGDFIPEFQFVYQSDWSTLKMALDLLARRPVDLASIYFTGIDTVSHLFWHFTWPEGFERHQVPESLTRRFADVIPLYCERVDTWIGEMLEAAGPNATVVVVSDHGFGPTGRLPWSGGHGRLTPGAPIAPPGILVMAGPGIAPGPRRLAGAHVLDVAPTLLHLLGVPAGEDMPGRVLREALDPESPDDLPRVRTLETVGFLRTPDDVPVDPGGDAERMERLRALGYLE